MLKCIILGVQCLTYTEIQHTDTASWSLMPNKGGGRNTCQQNVNVVSHYCCADGNGT